MFPKKSFFFFLNNFLLVSLLGLSLLKQIDFLVLFSLELFQLFLPKPLDLKWIRKNIEFSLLPFYVREVPYDVSRHSTAPFSRQLPKLLDIAFRTFPLFSEFQLLFRLSFS